MYSSIERHQALALSTSTFVISFQNSDLWSTKEWVEMNQNIPVLHEFTACHWERIRYFSTDAMYVWSYCIADRTNTNAINCTQAYSFGNSSTANQQLIHCIWINGVEYRININDYRHRTWNHVCWSYSSYTKTNKLYYNGENVGIQLVEEGMAIPASDDFRITSFILGQEPDVLTGEFSVDQLFHGELSEVNLWDEILDDDSILAMSNCEIALKGNAIVWQEDLITNHGPLTQYDIDIDSLCKESERYAIFPKRESISTARDLCVSHGGQIISPQSSSENELMMNILEKHKDICLEENPMNPANAGKAAWLGLTKESSVWYYLNENNKKIGLNFTNWSNYQEWDTDTDCSYSNFEGKWSSRVSCSSIELCTICKIIGNPFFTVNGLCYDTLFDFNYYIVLDDLNRIDYYEGYKASNIINKNGSWTFTPKRGNDATNSKLKLEIGEYPLGRQTWSVYDPKCKVSKTEYRLVSISKCRVGHHFTCDSGVCINLRKRCDQIIDCDDASDERGCSLIQIPNN